MSGLASIKCVIWPPRVPIMVLGMKPGDNLVYGHTHQPFINEEKTVANTGSWVDEGPADRPRKRTY